MWQSVMKMGTLFITDPKPCAAHTCRMLCPHGFALDDDGCPKCQCHDPCSEIQCPGALNCELEDVACIKQPCPPVPRCEYEHGLSGCISSHKILFMKKLTNTLMNHIHCVLITPTCFCRLL